MFQVEETVSAKIIEHQHACSIWGPERWPTWSEQRTELKEYTSNHRDRELAYVKCTGSGKDFLFESEWDRNCWSTDMMWYMF